MTAAKLLEILNLIDTAVVMWREFDQDEEDLFALREQMKDMNAEQKVALLLERSAALQASADDLRAR